MEFEYLEHTADAKFRAYGKSLEEAFVNSAKATFGLLIECNKVKPNVDKKIKINARKVESLLYDFLEELLFLLDVDGFLLSKIENIKIWEDNGFNLECSAIGDHFKEYNISGNIKNTTPNREVTTTPILKLYHIIFFNISNFFAPKNIPVRVIIDIESAIIGMIATLSSLVAIPNDAT